jgi:hypothetical protein
MEYYPPAPVQPQPQPVGQRPNGIYPPTGWPAEWERSRRPEPNASSSTNLGPNGYPQDVKYGWRDDQPHDSPYATASAPASGRREERRSRGRSEGRYTDGQMSGAAGGYNTGSVPSPHVRFALPDERTPRDPPPAYSR